MSSVADLYRQLWHYAAGARARLILASSMLVASQLLKLAFPWLAAQAIDTLQHASDAAGLRACLPWVGAIIASAAASWALHGPGRVLERTVAVRVRCALSDELVRRAAAAPLAWHEAQHSAELAHRMSQASQALANFTQSQFIYLQNAVTLVGPLVALVLLSGWTGGVAIVGLGAIALTIVAFDRALMRLAVRENDAERRYSAALLDVLTNVATVLSLRLRDATRRLLARRLAHVMEPLRRSIAMAEWKWCAVDLLTVLLTWSLVIAHAWRSSAEGALMLGGVFMVYQYAQQAGGVIVAIGAHYQGLTRMQVDYASADPIWTAAERRSGPMEPPAAWRQLQVDGLEFRHRGTRSDRPGLNGVSLALRRGERVALVGGSGAGKTTLMRVMAGLYDASSGCYTFDGMLHPGVRDLGRISTLVPQDAELFDGTVRDNLTFGVPHPEEAVSQAIRIAGLEPVLAGLAHGLDTVVSERGLNLSGGQKQRIALARGVLAARGSSLVFLDEPTSSLDAVTEARVFAALCAAFPDATLIASVHRLHLLPRFDRVVLMAQGRVADTGTVDELLARQPLFRELWARSTQVESTAAGPGETEDLRAA